MGCPPVRSLRCSGVTERGGSLMRMNATTQRATNVRRDHNAWLQQVPAFSCFDSRAVHSGPVDSGRVGWGGSGLWKPKYLRLCPRAPVLFCMLSSLEGVPEGSFAVKGFSGAVPRVWPSAHLLFPICPDTTGAFVLILLCYAQAWGLG